MSRLYAATVIAAIVTLAIATRVLMLRASQSAIEDLLARLRFDIDWLLRAAKNRIDDWIAGALADRARKAGNTMAHEVHDGESWSAGLDHGSIDDVVRRCEPGYPCRLRDCSGDADEAARSTRCRTKMVP
jgi:hypothetical protein